MGTFRLLFPLIIGTCILYSLNAAPAPDGYPTKYDDIDYKSILKSHRLLNNYVKCLLNEGACTAEGKLLLELLPDAIGTKCAKCNTKQRKGTLDVIEIMQKEHKDSWDILQKRWDPENNLTEPLLEMLRKENA